MPLHESLVLVVAEGLPLCASVSYGSLCSVAGHVEMYIQGKGTYEERLQLVFELVVVSCALHSAPFFGLHTYIHTFGFGVATDARLSTKCLLAPAALGTTGVRTQVARSTL